MKFPETRKHNINKTTKQFLLSISKHCSNSVKLKYEEYYVVICKHDGRIPMYIEQLRTISPENTVRMYPHVEIFPDVHHRKQANKLSAVNHVILDHFHDEVFDHIDEHGNIVVKEDCLVPGTYKYGYNYGTTGPDYRAGRHWMRIR